MATNVPPVDLPLKPRVLIADDSRIVRAMLIKHIQNQFEYREALDGEQAWETLLIDPNIRVLITDLTMPNLDGYGLLERIRSSKISRIRDMPVVVVSGSDEHRERERAMANGATDLITKGIATAQLLSRLDVLSKLVDTQREYEHSLEALVSSASNEDASELSSPYALKAQADAMLSAALRHKKNFILLSMCVGLKHTRRESDLPSLPTSVVNAVGQLLQGAVRQTDSVAKSGDAEFTFVTGAINVDSARNFAGRLCRAIAGANLLADKHSSMIASCGLVSLCENGADDSAAVSLSALWEIAHRRGILGLHHGLSGVVGVDEEKAFRKTSSA
jgi:two-component system cell cycle response regulator